MYILWKEYTLQTHANLLGLLSGDILFLFFSLSVTAPNPNTLLLTEPSTNLLNQTNTNTLYLSYLLISSILSRPDLNNPRTTTTLPQQQHANNIYFTCVIVT